MQRKKHDAAFKGRVALEVVKGLMTVNEIAADYGGHPNLITKWKRQILDGVPGIFSSRAALEGHDKETEELISSSVPEDRAAGGGKGVVEKKLHSSVANGRDLIEPEHPDLSISEAV